MKFAIVPVTPFQQNCSILWCEQTARAAVVDPGGDVDLILAAVKKLRVEPERILLTHGHIDHAGASAQLAAELKIPIEGPQRKDKFWLDSIPSQGAMFGLPPMQSFEPDRWLEDGDSVGFGKVELEVLHCPGHTPGHVVFFGRADRLAIVGDVLFQGSIGRTDLPRGDFPTLIDSIRNKLWPLGEEVSFIPGHGPLSSFGEERQSNPFVGDRALSRAW